MTTCRNDFNVCKAKQKVVEVDSQNYFEYCLECDERLIGSTDIDSNSWLPACQKIPMSEKNQTLNNEKMLFLYLCIV